MLSCDVTGEASVATLMDEVLAETGRIDLLVKHAGAGLLAGAEESLAAQTQALFDVNVFDVLRMTNAVLPIQLRKRAAATGTCATCRIRRRGCEGSNRRCAEDAAGRPTRQVRIMRRFVPSPLSTRAAEAQPSAGLTSISIRPRIALCTIVLAET